MKKEFEGFVIYNKTNKKSKAYAVVSENYECKAEAPEIPEKFKEFIIPIEDKRFFNHNGIDIKGTTRALLRNFMNMKVLEGGSTISQQLARNILKDNSRTLSRKIRESIIALKLEYNYSKDDILNLYFNNVYFGKNLRGVRSASLYYFDKEPKKLNNSEIIYLLTILRGPNYYLSNLDATNKRMKLLSELLFNSNKLNLYQYNKIGKKSNISGNHRINILRNNTIPFITENIDFQNKRIDSTLVSYYQDFAENLVRKSKYPTSIVIIRNKKVIGFYSFYGSDYPFIFKSNVGSTLKPFIYYYAKKNGINNDQKFSSYKNNLNWNVREATSVNSKLNIDEALYHSNNNAFINISETIGIENTLNFLSDSIQIKDDEVFPSAILGATKNGLSLHQLTLAYNDFLTENIDDEKMELMKILNKIFKTKLNFNIENAFLKTGTTNNNDERLAIMHHADTTFGILRNENPLNDSSKEGNMFHEIKRFFGSYFKQQLKEYKWI
ncbi:transglycosylase domain-containing protein [Chishuiella sp.]|uniref:transglycosylase domain-containing protein n=1 Tax=Chishuiella sp. TaxID=1969467 RepID=UPI0028AAA903|nr:transglycosylase domain-containing protein [Chishuiella sp.]